MTHDEAVRRYLAVRAVMADFVRGLPAQAQDRATAVMGLLDDLGRFLATEYNGHRTSQATGPTQYEVPAAFDPNQLRDRLRPLLMALSELEASLAEPRRQP